MDGEPDISITVSRESCTPVRHLRVEETTPLLGDKEVKKNEGKKDKEVKKDKWKRFITVCSLWVAYLVCNAAYSIIGPFFPNEATTKGASPITTGIIMSSSAFCVVLLSPVFGYYLTHLGVRFMMFSGIFLVGGAYLLMGFTSMLSSGWMFIVYCVLLRMTEGVGSALYMTSTFTILPILYPNSIGMITGLFEVGGGIGFVVAPPLGGYLYELGGFRLPFIVVGGLVLLFLVPLMFLVNGLDVPKSESSVLRLIFRMCTDVPFLILVIVNILSIASLAFFGPVFQPFLTQEYGLTPVYVGVVFFIGPVLYMAFSLPLGSISDKLNPRYLVVVGLAMYTLGFFFIGPPEFISTPKLWVNCVAYGVIGLACAFTIIPAYPDMLIIAERLLRNEGKVTMTAVVSGIMSSSLSFGEFLGPLIGGALTEVYSFPTSSFLFALLFGAVFFLLLGVSVIDQCTSVTTSKGSVIASKSSVNEESSSSQHANKPSTA